MISSMLVSLTLASSPAQACGGFFCNRDAPVDQSGEDIVFSVDRETNTTTMHVQVAYSGDAADFAWIVPVSANPEILLSNDRLFQELSYRTAPTFTLQNVEKWDCAGGYYGYGVDAAGASYSASSAPNADSGAGTVVVVSQAHVGPYETVTLRARDATGLLDWLQANGYSLPDNLDGVLAPYIADEAYFVALKLAKDQSVGALQPISLRYPGTTPSIPIQLTSVAATPDMRLHVYVLGEKRSVPDSYLHVKINDLVVDWFSYGSNYEDAITVAANEAGGQAFATDYAGTSDVMHEVLFRPGQYDIGLLASSSDAYVFFDRLLQMGFVGDAQMLELFREFLPIPSSANVDEQSFYNCLECYSSIVDTIPFDAAAFAAAIDERIVTPLHDAQQMFDDNPALTRLTSSVSPVEMTVDPTFVFNPDMEQVVSQDRRASLEILCGFGGDWDTSPRKLVLADGRSYDLPSQEWFRNAGTTEYEYLSELMTVYALVIEDTSASGQPDVIADHTQAAFDAAQAFNEQTADNLATGCGCDSSGGAAVSLLLPLAALGLRRRRSA